MNFLKCTCPHCENRVEFPDEAAAQTILCPHCQGEFTLPTVSSAVPPFAALLSPPLASPPKLAVQASPSWIEAMAASFARTFLAIMALLVIGVVSAILYGYQPKLVATTLVLIVYFLPSFNAFANKHHNASAITLLNLFLGWTVLGWIIALVWSATKPKASLQDLSR